MSGLGSLEFQRGYAAAVQTQKSLEEALADELERMLEHTSTLAEEDASVGDLLEDLEHRLEGIVRRLRGQVTTAADWEPHTYFYPMPEEQ